MISLDTFILQMRHCSRWKRRPTTPSVRADRVRLGKAVCFAALSHVLASNQMNCGGQKVLCSQMQQTDGQKSWWDPELVSFLYNLSSKYSCSAPETRYRLPVDERSAMSETGLLPYFKTLWALYVLCIMYALCIMYYDSVGSQEC